MIFKPFKIVFLFLILQLNVYAQTFNKTKLDSLFESLGSSNQSMGSVTISVNGLPVYQNAIGYSQINGNSRTPATNKTIYRIGSITKMFTATIIFQLIEEGKLSRTTYLEKFFPQIPHADKITISDMLSHRSGLYNFTNDSLYTTYMTKPKSKTELIKIFSKQKPVFSPDTKTEYSNTNFVLLGYIIEKLTGNSYAKELKTRICSKIDLANTYYGTKASIAKNEACSYKYESNYDVRWKLQPETDMSIPGGAGSIVSTSADLTKFIYALFEGKLISKESLELMTSMKDQIGMGMLSLPYWDKKGYGHLGGIDAFTSLLAYYPQEKLAIAYTANGGTASLNNIAIAILNILYNKTLANKPLSKTVENKNIVKLEEYIGEYSSTQTPLKITISKVDKQLVAQANGQSQFLLEYRGEHQFVYKMVNIVMIFDPMKKSFTLQQNGGLICLQKRNKAE